MRSIQVALLAVLVLGFAGCHQSQPTPQNKMSRDREFENSKQATINTDTYYAAGQLAEASNKPDVAIKNYQACLKLDPKNRDALYRLGVMFATEKRFYESEETWKTY